MALKESLRRQEDVALTITRQLFSKEKYQDQNLIFSPFSLNVALSVMAAGSDGGTLDQLLSFLRFDSVDDLTDSVSHLLSAMFSSGDAASSSCSLSLANGLWLWADESLSLSNSFKQLVATHYKATLDSVDFQQADQVRHVVNLWVEKETNGLITELLPPGAVISNARLIFANALRFKGDWECQFHERTFNSEFHLLNGTSVKVPFMSSVLDRSISAFDGFKVLRLPYKQGADTNSRFSMYILLPDANDGLPALIEKMGSESGFLEGKIPQQKVKVGRFRIPKFKFSFTFEASDVLKELGVVSPFSSNDANLTKMVDNPEDKLYIKSMFHKASIEVDEEGTEAAASGAFMGVFLCIPHGIDFVADHPFLVLIREDSTGAILFVGQVLNPRDGASTSVKNLGKKSSFGRQAIRGRRKRSRDF